MNEQLPPAEIRGDLARARRLEWWTLFWMTSVVLVMWLVMGSSQAMKTALVEDVLSLVPALVFLIAAKLEEKPPTRKFPFGFERVHSLASVIAAVALAAVGAFLLFESTMALVNTEHPTIEPIRLFGRDIWSGWLMCAALVYSVIPPMILGRMKQPVAQRLHDEVLHTDAMMQRADWMTGLAGLAGVLGVGLGYWWADAAAAATISLSILNDGARSLRVATAELVDGAPRELGSSDIAEDALRLEEALEQRFPGSEVRLRETGRYIRAEVMGVASAECVDLAEIWPGHGERNWRLVQVSFVPPSATEDLSGQKPRRSKQSGKDGEK